PTGAADCRAGAGDGRPDGTPSALAALSVADAHVIRRPDGAVSGIRAGGMESGDAGERFRSGGADRGGDEAGGAGDRPGRRTLGFGGGASADLALPTNAARPSTPG